VAGPILAAVAAVAGMVLIIGLLIGGLWWLRADAARDARAAERHRCVQDRLLANNEAIEEQARLDRAAAAAAARARTAWLEELEAARQRAVDLETLLKARLSRVVCYPRDLARELNR
jgi:hypothetical protein